MQRTTPWKGRRNCRTESRKKQYKGWFAFFWVATYPSCSWYCIIYKRLLYRGYRGREVMWGICLMTFIQDTITASIQEVMCWESKNGRQWSIFLNDNIPHYMVANVCPTVSYVFLYEKVGWKVWIRCSHPQTYGRNMVRSCNNLSVTPTCSWEQWHKCSKLAPSQSLH